MQWSRITKCTYLQFKYACIKAVKPKSFLSFQLFHANEKFNVLQTEGFWCRADFSYEVRWLERQPIFKVSLVNFALRAYSPQPTPFEGND